MLIDLHTHTYPLSLDSFLDADDLVDHAKQMGLDGICLSEHDALWQPDVAFELGRRHDFLVLPAIEVSTEHGHMLCYGLSTYSKDFYRIAALANGVQSASALMVAAHPFRRQISWSELASEHEYAEALQAASQNPAYQYCCALERVNGLGSARENAFSAQLCDLLNLPGTGGTDSHQLSHIGRCATEFQRRIASLEDLIDELKTGRFRAVDLRSAAQPEAPPVAPDLS